MDRKEETFILSESKTKQNWKEPYGGEESYWYLEFSHFKLFYLH
jgi:hypothetical protein